MVWGVKKENVGQFADLFPFSRKLNRQQSPIDVRFLTTLYRFDELSFAHFIRYTSKYHLNSSLWIFSFTLFKSLSIKSTSLGQKSHGLFLKIS